MQPTAHSAKHRPRHRHRRLCSGALLVDASAAPDAEGALEDASRTLGPWAYPTVAAFAFFETAAFIGLRHRGETAVLVGGVVAPAARSSSSR